MENILKEIKQEREKQDQKWGIQNHPSVCQILLNREGGCTPERMCEEYEIPSENRAKFLCNNNAKKGQLTWANIALEEFSESIAAENEIKRREELIQLASVVVAWVESIDRNNK